MLVITRRPTEAIVIETKTSEGIECIELEVIVLGIRGRQVRIGIKAPKEIKVHRKEIYQRQQAQEQADLQECPLSISE